MEYIATKKAPQAIGPYSQAVTLNNLVFCSGQIALDPHTGSLAGSDIDTQTKQVLANLNEVLTAAGSSFDQVVKTTIFLKDMSDFAVVNTHYEAAFGNHKPARATVAVAGLPLDVLVEIECIATTS
ncbi:hypothetical protein DID76_03325 [Candidatus Marinamargulisbacteria bacterium SCGC AG-414-C22]|nr:hypothetical protein DID76_03325 [Candidatus Marinamargulisbacteria bacterium SCGC AG-414-C22]